MVVMAMMAMMEMMEGWFLRARMQAIWPSIAERPRRRRCCLLAGLSIVKWLRGRVRYLVGSSC